MKQIIRSAGLIPFLSARRGTGSGKAMVVGGMYPVRYREQYRSETKGIGTEKP